MPQGLVEQEFASIWTQVEREQQASGLGFADENTTEEAARADYRAIAERRVRLGLLLAEVGATAEVKISDDNPSTVNFAASTVTSMPSARAVLLVTGPIDAAFTPFSAAAPAAATEPCTVEELVKVIQSGLWAKTSAARAGASWGITVR